MRVVDTARGQEIWSHFADKMIAFKDAKQVIHQKNGPDLVQIKNEDGTITNAAHRSYSIGMGSADQYIARDVDGQGHVVRAEFGFGHCSQGSGEYECTAGVIELQPDGSYTGHAVVSIPGVDNNIGTTLLKLGGQRKLIPDGVERSVQDVEESLAPAFQKQTPETQNPNAALVELAPQEAFQMMRTIDYSLADVWHFATPPAK